MNEADPLSFLPEDYLERKAQRRTNVICAILAGIVMAAIGSAFSITEKTNRDAESRHAQVEQQYADAAQQIAQVQQIEAKQGQMARRAELASSLLEKIPRSNILAEVTNCVPDGASLLDFSLNSVRKSTAPPPPSAAEIAKNGGAAPAPEPIAYDVTLKVSGIAPNDVDVAEFIRRLSHSPLFKDVNLIISEEFAVADMKVRRFQVEMSLDGNADVRKLPIVRGATNATAQVPTN